MRKLNASMIQGVLLLNKLRVLGIFALIFAKSVFVGSRKAGRFKIAVAKALVIPLRGAKGDTAERDWWTYPIRILDVGYLGESRLY